LKNPDFNKIDLLLKYILAVASQEDWPNHEIGPIHLIKYIYLADLKYAEHTNGGTFTGLTWKFHHYGPWSVDAYSRLEPAMQEIGANERRFSSPKYEDDIIRWSIRDEKLYDEIDAQLPLVITGVIQRAVHTFGSDTESLLHHVYETWPMLQAAPGELLDFTPPDFMKDKPEQVSEDDSCKPLTVRQQKKIKEKMKAIKEQLREKLNAKKKEGRFQPTHPRYDEVFFEGLEQLDSLAGEPIEPLEGSAAFSKDVWKSKARFDPDVL